MSKLAFLVSVSLISSYSAGAMASADPDAQLAFLRTDCANLANCFESTGTLTSWIWGTRKPSAESPLLVDMGPGSFEGFGCPRAEPRNGHVTFRGSGRDQTRIVAKNSDFAAITVLDCDKLSFQDLSIEGHSVGVWWRFGGSSQWSNISLIAGTGDSLFGLGWYEQFCAGSRHFWFGSQIRAAGGFANAGYLARCGDNWFYGGDIEARAAQGSWGGGMLSNTAVWVDKVGQMRVFGSTLRSNAGDFPSTIGTLAGVFVKDDGEFHMHGGIINTNSVSSSVAMNPTGVLALNNAFVHTPETAFIVKTGAAGGQAQRLEQRDAARVQSPFQWPTSDEPPSSNSTTPGSPLVTSVHGADTFVETDCNAQGECDGDGDETHLMIYNDRACPASNPWFDSTAGACRK